MSYTVEDVCERCERRLEVKRPLSKQRRKFVIFTVFDFVLITSLWLLCTVKKGGDDWLHDFFTEVNLFEQGFIQRSLFDLVLISNLRMFWLLSFYLLLRCDHWAPVALCTSISTIFNVLKIFYFFGQRHHDDILPQYFLVIASLLVAWLELWLMPFHVLNTERCSLGYEYQRHCASPSTDSAHSNFSAQSARLLRSPQVAARRVRSGVSLSSSSQSRSAVLHANGHYRTHTVSEEDEFHSALEYSSSDEQLEQIGNVKASVLNAEVRRNLCNKSLHLIASARNTARLMFTEASNWRSINVKGAILRVNDETNTYYVKAEFLHRTPKQVFDAIWWKAQNWNKNILEFHVVCKIKARTDIVLSKSTPAFGGCIAQRNFMDVRVYEHDSAKDLFFGVYTSVELNETDARQGIWGKNGVNAMRVTPSNNTTASTADFTATTFEWLMNTDLQGTLPRVLIRKTMSTFFCDYVRDLELFLRNTSA